MLLTLSPRIKYGSPLFLSTEAFKVGLDFFMLRVDFRPILVKLIALRLRLLMGGYHSGPMSIDTCEREVIDLNFLRLASLFSLKRTKVFVAYLRLPVLVVLVMNPLLDAARMDSSDLKDFLDRMRLLENLIETTDRADHLLDVSSKSLRDDCGVLAAFALMPRFIYLLSFNQLRLGTSPLLDFYEPTKKLTVFFIFAVRLRSMLLASSSANLEEGLAASLCQNLKNVLYFVLVRAVATILISDLALA